MNKYITSFVFTSLLLGFSVSTNAESTTADIVVNPISKGPSVVPRNGVRVPFLTFRIKAEKDIKINEIIVRQTGLSTNDDVDSMMIESRYGKSLSANVGNDGLATIRFRKDYEIEAGKAHVMNLLVNLAGRARASMGFDLVDIKAEETVIESPVTTTQKASYSRPSYAARRKSLIPRGQTTRTTQTSRTSRATSENVYKPKTNYSRSRRYSGSYRPFRGNYRPYSSSTE